jgi:hypothetical protein
MRRMSKKKNLTNIHVVRLEMGRIIIIGKSRAISTSKIRKITAIKKNRREKGNRDELLGSNPHSKGDLFSRSIIVFFDKIEARPITTTTMMAKIVAMIEMLIITYSKLSLDHLIGSQRYYYTK